MKPTKTVARNHHYLPQCYLLGFAVPRKKGKQVFVFDRSTGQQFQTNIKNIAQERDFNRVEIDGHEPDVFEKNLAKFESELAPALNRIIEAKSLQNLEDKTTLMNFIAWISLQNPRMREIWRDFTERVVKGMASAMSRTPATWDQHVASAATEIPDTSSSMDVPYEDVRKFLDDGLIRVDVPTETHLGLALENVDAIFDLLMQRRWRLVVAHHNSGGFITSDQPACLMWSDPKMRGEAYSPGHGLANTQLVMALSSKLALIGAFEIEDQVIVGDASLVEKINGATIFYSRRQIYARDLNFTYCSGTEVRKASRLANDSWFKRTRQ